MIFTIQAACGCNTGKIRKNNEDNFYFDGKFLNRENDGLKEPHYFEQILTNHLCVAVFDGMGGENFGEYASYTAARLMHQSKRSLKECFLPEEKYLDRVVQEMDHSVVGLQKELLADRIGSTVVGFYFSQSYVHVFNVGDSRAYRLRNGELTQLSFDHVERRRGRESKKAPLTQHLGFGSEDIMVEPYLTKEKITKGDWYLLCSDGLTDMLKDTEIAEIMRECNNADASVKNLMESALEHGGRDNITVIVCKIT